MATNTASTGNWSDTSKWSLGHVPISGEDVVVPNGVTIAWDTGSVLPATGAFNSVACTGTGRITLALGTVGSCTLNSTSLQTGTNSSGALQITSGTSGQTFTHNGTVTAGTASGAYGIYNSATGNLVQNGAVAGGSGSDAIGIVVTAAAATTIVGNVSGAGGTRARGFYNGSTGVWSINGNITAGGGTLATAVDNSGGGAGTLTNCNITNSATSTAYAGSIAPTFTPNTSTVVTWGGVALGLRPVAGAMLTGTTCGAVAGNITLPADGTKVLTTQAAFGVAGISITPTYVAPVTAEVLRPADGGTAFGASSGVNGTLVNCPAVDARHKGSTYYGKAGALADGSCYVPTAAQTLWNVNVDATVGTLSMPNTGSGSASLNADLVLNTAHFGPGNATAGTNGGYGPGQAAQLLTDQGIVQGAADWILPGSSDLLAWFSTTGNATLPAESKVDTTNGPYGVGGNGSTPGLNMALYTLISGVVAAGDVRLNTARYSGGSNGTWDAVSKTDVVAAAYVVTGHDNYTGGSAGSYPTTATSQAAQLLTDQGFVTAAAAGILDSVTLLTIPGTYKAVVVGDVKDGVHYGPASTLEGTYVQASVIAIPTIRVITGRITQ